MSKRSNETMTNYQQKKSQDEQSKIVREEMMPIQNLTEDLKPMNISMFSHDVKSVTTARVVDNA